MTIPFRFAPGCCDPCGPVCGKTYSPEQFTVVSGTYDPTTKMLSPGGVITVSLDTENFFYLRPDSDSTDISYLYGDEPFVIEAISETTIKFSHGDWECQLGGFTDSDIEDAVSAYNRGADAFFDQHGYLVLSQLITVISPPHHSLGNTVNTNMKYSEYRPSIRNDGTSPIEINTITVYEHLPDLGDLSCSRFNRCFGWYVPYIGDSVTYTAAEAFDGIESFELALSCSGPVLDDLAGTYTLNRQCNNCGYDAAIDFDTTFHVPMYGDRYILDTSRFAYPNEIVWTPFVVHFSGDLSLIPYSDTDYVIEFYLHSSGEVLPHDSVDINNSFVCPWRYIACPSAAGVWKSTQTCLGRPLYCWDIKNADYSIFYPTASFYFGTNLVATGESWQLCSDLNFETGVSSKFNVTPSCGGTSNGVVPIAYNGQVVTSSNSRAGYTRTNYYNDDEPCQEALKTCPYNMDVVSQGNRFYLCFSGRPIEFQITGLNRVL